MIEKARDTKNTLFIDYLRGFMVLLVVLDHAMHAYSPHYKKFWYLQDIGGETFFDVWHMHNDAIMMPMLFFLAGLFILPSLKSRGLLSFIKQKAVHLGIPFVLGILAFVPPQTFVKYLLKTDSSMSFMTYYKDVFLQGEIQASGFWFLYYLIVLTTIAVVISYLVPALLQVCKSFSQWLVERPLRGLLTLSALVAVLLTISDIIWSPFYWIGFQKIFYVRGSRFLAKAFFFFLGIGLSMSEILKNTKFLEMLSKHALSLFMWSLFVGTAYVVFTLTYYHLGAYDMSIYRHLVLGGAWSDAFNLVNDLDPKVLVRITLLGFFMTSMIITYCAVFYRFLNTSKPFWLSLAACSYGIFIIHEPMVVWAHYWLLDNDWSDYLKFLISGGSALAISWIITQYILLPIPFIRKIIWRT